MEVTHVIGCHFEGRNSSIQLKSSLRKDDVNNHREAIDVATADEHVTETPQVDDVTKSSPKTCDVCSQGSGVLLVHDHVSYVCSNPQKCICCVRMSKDM